MIVRKATPITPQAENLHATLEWMKEHKPLVVAIAHRVHQTLPGHVEFDDLYQAGMIGLLWAKNRYKPFMAVPFPLYAKHRIKGAMLDHLRLQDWASRDDRDRLARLENVRRTLEGTHHRAPTETELADAYGVPLSNFRAMLVRLPSIPVDIDDVARQAPSWQPNPEEQAISSQFSRELWGAVHKLKPRWQRIIALRYRYDMTMKEIAVIAGVNESRICQIMKAAHDALLLMLGPKFGMLRTVPRQAMVAAALPQTTRKTKRDRLPKGDL